MRPRLARKQWRRAKRARKAAAEQQAQDAGRADPVGDRLRRANRGQ